MRIRKRRFGAASSSSSSSELLLLNPHASYHCHSSSVHNYGPPPPPPAAHSRGDHDDGNGLRPPDSDGDPVQYIVSHVATPDREENKGEEDAGHDDGDRHDDDAGHAFPGPGQGRYSNGQDSGSYSLRHRPHGADISRNRARIFKLSRDDPHSSLPLKYATTSPPIQLLRNHFPAPSNDHLRTSLIHGNSNKIMHPEHLYYNASNAQPQDASTSVIDKKLGKYVSGHQYHHAAEHHESKKPEFAKQTDTNNIETSENVDVIESNNRQSANKIDRRLYVNTHKAQGLEDNLINHNDRTAMVCNTFDTVHETKRCGRRSGRGWQCKNMRSTKDQDTIYCDYHRQKINQHHASWNARNKKMMMHTPKKKPRKTSNVKSNCEYDIVKGSNSVYKLNMSAWRDRNLIYDADDMAVDSNIFSRAPHEQQLCSSKVYHNVSKSNTSVGDHQINNHCTKAKDNGMTHNSILRRALEVARMAEKHRMVIMRPLLCIGVEATSNIIKGVVKEMLPNLIEDAHDHVYDTSSTSYFRQQCCHHPADPEQDSCMRNVAASTHGVINGHHGEIHSPFILKDGRNCNNTIARANMNGDDHNHMHKEECIDQNNKNMMEDENPAYMNCQNIVANLVDQEFNHDDETPLDDMLRCKRIDGRGWRCKKMRLSVMTADGLKQYGYCEHHHKLLQKQHKKRSQLLASRSVITSKVNSKKYNKKRKNRDDIIKLAQQKSINSCIRTSHEKTSIATDKLPESSLVYPYTSAAHDDQESMIRQINTQHKNKSKNHGDHDANSILKESTLTDGGINNLSHNGIKGKDALINDIRNLESPAFMMGNHHDSSVIEHIGIQKKPKKKKKNTMNEEHLVNALTTLWGSNVSIGRCSRMDGRGWQCKQNRVEGSIYCEHHRVKISHNHAIWKANLNSRKQTHILKMGSYNNKLSTSIQSKAIIKNPPKSLLESEQMRKIEMSMNLKLDQLSNAINNPDVLDNNQAPLGQDIINTRVDTHHDHEITVKENMNRNDDTSSGIVNMINSKTSINANISHDHDQYVLELRAQGDFVSTDGVGDHDDPLVEYHGYDRVLHIMRKRPKTRLLQEII